MTAENITSCRLRENRIEKIVNAGLTIGSVSSRDDPTLDSPPIESFIRTSAN